MKFRYILAVITSFIIALFYIISIGNAIISLSRLDIGIKTISNERTTSVPIETIPEPQQYKEYRLTSYYTGDPTGSGKCTASGICTNKFTINNKGWYLYNEMLVLASGYEYKLHDLVVVMIDDAVYNGIVLDKCGACRKDTRLDLFVSNKESIIDRGYKGVNPIKVIE